MNKQELIEKLTSNRDKCFEEAKKYADLSWNRQILDAKALVYMQVINWVEQLDEPQAEKVEVPDFVAEWYEEHKYNLDNSIWAYASSITQFHSRDLKLNDFEKWFSDFNNEPIETLIRMKDGYTVKPKRWIVKYIPPFVDEFRYYSMDDEIFDITESSWTSDKEDAYPFTEKEKAEAVALLVDGSVEEV